MHGCYPPVAYILQIAGLSQEQGILLLSVTKRLACQDAPGSKVW